MRVVKISSTPGNVFKFHLQQSASFRIHRRLPQLLRVHFAQPLVALQTQSLLALFEDGSNQFGGSCIFGFFAGDFHLVRRPPQSNGGGRQALQFTKISRADHARV